MLIKRLISALIIVSFLLLLIWLDVYLGRADGLNRPGMILGLVSLAVVAVASGELATMWRRSSIPIDVGWSVFASLIAGGGACAPLFWPAWCQSWHGSVWDGWVMGVLAAVTVLFASEMVRLGTIEHQASRLGRHVLMVVYVSLPVAFMAALRLWNSDNEQGLTAFLAAVVTVKFSDVGAYFTGKTWGRTPMAPKLSPKKTMEGAVGGLVAGIVGTALILAVIAPWWLTEAVARWWFILVFGILVTLAGMFGDLAESFLKRDVHTKDSSAWLPGLGGILDVIDSLVFGLPASYLIFRGLGPWGWS